MPAKRKGTEVRQTMSIRLEPSHKKLMIKTFGSVQKALDLLITYLETYKGKK
jgi:hypothetical protein